MPTRKRFQLTDGHGGVWNESAHVIIVTEPEEHEVTGGRGGKLTIEETAFFVDDIHAPGCPDCQSLTLQTVETPRLHATAYLRGGVSFECQNCGSAFRCWAESFDREECLAEATAAGMHFFAVRLNDANPNNVTIV
jgi:predicted RNA-binding Zn-ribbon protein involved in translation (DUF1610 family)